MSDTGLLGRASRLLAGVGGAALFVMMSWTIVDIVTRYALAKPLRGSIDLVESTLVLVVFLALPECFRRGEQIAVDILDHFAKPRTVALLKLFANIATLVFVLLLAYTGVQPFVDAMNFGDKKPELPIPIFALLGAIEFALAVSALVLTGSLIRDARSYVGRDRT